MHLLEKLTELRRRPLFSKVLVNTGWMIADKVLRLGVGLLVTVKIARYLGPEQFGKWNYAIAFATLFGSFATLGLDTIIVRDLVRTPAKVNQILGTAFALKLIAALTAVLIVTLSIAVLKPNDIELILLVMLSATAFIFQATNIVDFYFQASIKSKYSVLAQNAAFLIMAVIKLTLLINHATLIQFAIATLAEAALTAIFMLWAFFLKGDPIRQWSFDRVYAFQILKDGSPQILAGLAVTVYYKIGLIMIGEILGDKAVGIYSAATRISEVWYFVPMSIAASVFPIFVKKREYSEKDYLVDTQKFYTIMFLLAFVVALITTAIGPSIINLLYGSRYEGAASILVLHIWAGLFVCLGLASGSTLTIQGLQKYNFYRTLIGCVSNVALNFLLIPSYGGVGAAAATVLSYGISIFSIGLFPAGRETFLMLVKSFNIFSVLVPARVS